MPRRSILSKNRQNASHPRDFRFCDFRFDRFDIPFDSIDIASDRRGGPPATVKLAPQNLVIRGFKHFLQPPQKLKIREGWGVWTDVRFELDLTLVLNSASCWFQFQFDNGFEVNLKSASISR